MSVLGLAALATATAAAPTQSYNCTPIAAWDRKATVEEQKAAKTFMLTKGEAKSLRFDITVSFDQKSVEVRPAGPDIFHIAGAHEIVGLQEVPAAGVMVYSFAFVGNKFDSAACRDMSPETGGCATLVKFQGMHGAKKDEPNIDIDPSPALLAPTAIMSYYRHIGYCVVAGRPS